jgi:hypothetical protein
MFLIVDNEDFYSLPTQWMVVGWDGFASLVLIDLNGLEEVNKYSSPSSLLLVKVILVERREDGFRLVPSSSYCLQSFQASIAF